MPMAATVGATMKTTTFPALRCWRDSKNRLVASAIAHSTITHSVTDAYQNSENADTHSVVGNIGTAAYKYNATTIHVPNAGPRSQPLGNVFALINPVMAQFREHHIRITFRVAP
jgi:hypothetical protein